MSTGIKNAAVLNACDVLDFCLISVLHLLLVDINSMDSDEDLTPQVDRIQSQLPVTSTPADVERTVSKTAAAKSALPPHLDLTSNNTPTAYDSVVSFTPETVKKVVKAPTANNATETVKTRSVSKSVSKSEVPSQSASSPQLKAAPVTTEEKPTRKSKKSDTVVADKGGSVKEVETNVTESTVGQNASVTSSSAQVKTKSSKTSITTESTETFKVPPTKSQSVTVQSSAPVVPDNKKASSLSAVGKKTKGKLSQQSLVAEDSVVTAVSAAPPQPTVEPEHDTPDVDLEVSDEGKLIS